MLRHVRPHGRKSTRNRGTRMKGKKAGGMKGKGKGKSYHSEKGEKGC